MTTALEVDKAALDLDVHVAQSSVETHKKTESSVVVTQFKTIFFTGMFQEYSKPLEKIAGMPCWTAIRTGKQIGLWTMLLLSKEGAEIARVKGCTLKDIAFSYSKEDIIVGLKVQHSISPEQSKIEDMVSAAARLKIIKDEEPFIADPEDM